MSAQARQAQPPQEVVLFEWPVAAGGHWAADGRAAPGDPLTRWILEKEPRGPSQEASPLDESPTLFRIFGELPIPMPEAAALGFADQYGQLGLGEFFLPNGKKPARLGEALALWAEEAFDLRMGSDLLLAISQEDTESLSRWIRPTDAGGLTFQREEGGRRCRLGMGPDHPLLRSLEAEALDLPRAARFVAQMLANEKLERFTQTRLLYEASTDSQRLVVLPSNLLGAMWFQLARGLAGDVEFRACRQCETWFRVSPDTSRSDRVYCSGPCRYQASYQRRSRARRLRAEGATIHSIATEMDVSLEEVRRWVKQTRRGKRR